MNNWKEKRFGEIATVIMGQSPSSDFYNNNGEGLPFMQGNRTFGNYYPLIDTWTTNPNKIAPKDSILMSVRAPVGDINIAPFKLCIGRGLCAINSKEEINSFLLYLLKYNLSRLKCSENGTTFTSINGDDIRKLKVTIPDLPMQKRIADILSAYDDLIENNNKRIVLLEKAAQELYKEWFVRFRFPGHETAEFENGLPKGWEYGHLKDTMSFSSGKVRPNSGCIYPVYGGNGILDYCDQYNSENSIIVGRVGAYCGSVYYEPEKCWVSDNALYAVCNDNEIYYNYHLLRLLQLNKRQVGTGQPLITQSVLGKIKIIIPSSSIILIFNNVAGQFISQQSILSKLNQNLAKQRDLLLPRLMSGKLEV